VATRWQRRVLSGGASVTQPCRFDDVYAQRCGHVADSRQAGSAVLCGFVALDLLFGDAEFVGELPLAPPAADTVP
jgi:hypothetical protein